MTAIRTKAFKSGNSVAVRLPRALGIEEGAALIIEPQEGGLNIRHDKGGSMAELVEALRRLPKPKGGWKRMPIDVPERESWADREDRPNAKAGRSWR